MTRTLHWFRNDLRLRDNTALAHAAQADAVDLVFVLDAALLSSDATGAPRLAFLLDCLQRLAATCEERGQRLHVLRGEPSQCLVERVRRLGIDRVTWNDDTSPFARARDRRVRRALEPIGAQVSVHVDRVVFTAAEIRSGSGEPYRVYSPFRRAWEMRWREEPQPARRAPTLPQRVTRERAPRIPDLAGLGFELGDVELPTGGEDAARRRLRAFLERGIERYAEDRNRPDVDGTSRLSPYLRFGAVSPRECVTAAYQAIEDDPRRSEGARSWLSELVWREFYASVLESHPRVLHESFREDLRELRWNHDPDGLEAWTRGRTGFPIVDAGMRQLAATGWMHNRVRMIVASFLTKDLLIDWREGERVFYRMLVDGDPASNNGGWQWSASTGTDPQPYFRIFNPISQSKRFDPEGRYLRRWLPELAGVPEEALHEPWRAPLLAPDYPRPILDHAARRQSALQRCEAARRSATR